MKQFLLTMAGVFAGLLLFLVGVPFLLIVMAAGAAQPSALPSHAVLELDLREDLSDQDAQNPLAAFSGGGDASKEAATPLISLKEGSGWGTRTRT